MVKHLAINDWDFKMLFPKLVRKVETFNRAAAVNCGRLGIQNAIGPL